MVTPSDVQKVGSLLWFGVLLSLHADSQGATTSHFVVGGCVALWPLLHSAALGCSLFLPS